MDDMTSSPYPPFAGVEPYGTVRSVVDERTGTFLGWDPQARTVMVVPISSRYAGNTNIATCDSGSEREGAYGHQQIAKEFEVHFTGVGRIVRPAKEAGERNPWEKVGAPCSCTVI